MFDIYLFQMIEQLVLTFLVLVLLGLVVLAVSLFD
mgnify:CR=1 FL=1